MPSKLGLKLDLIQEEDGVKASIYTFQYYCVTQYFCK